MSALEDRSLLHFSCQIEILALIHHSEQPRALEPRWTRWSIAILPRCELQVNEGVVVHRLVVSDVIKDAHLNIVASRSAPRLGLDIDFETADFVVVRREVHWDVWQETISQRLLKHGLP